MGPRDFYWLGERRVAPGAAGQRLTNDNMEPIASFQGLVTGINFRDLVDQIILAESRPKLLLNKRIAELDRRVTAWGDFKTRVQTLFNRSEDLSDAAPFKKFLTSLTGVTDGTAIPMTVSAGSKAAPGSFTSRVLQLATNEKVGSLTYADSTVALNLSGEFLVGGKAVQVATTDSLDSVASLINKKNTGTSPSGVSATVIAAAGGGDRLVLTADSSGASGIDLADGSAGVLRSLGFLDTTTSIQHQTSDGAKSDTFTSSSSAVATLLGLSTPPASGSVTVGTFGVTIDLSTDSLTDIASAINSAASGAGSSVSASVVEETDADGNTVKRLDVSGTTSFTDTNRILETLGVLRAGRASVAHEVEADVLTDGDAVTAATGGTLLVDLWAGGSAAGVTIGDTLTLKGTRGDGSTFTKTFDVVNGTTDYQDLVDALNSNSDGFQVGSRMATASIVDGRIVVTDDTAGDSQLALRIIANNEGDGTLDFGDFSVATAGRDRELAAGLDAEIEVDGVFFQRSSNAITDLIDGVTLNLSEATSDTVTVSINRDEAAIVSSIEAFIKAYNTVAEFVTSQFTGVGAEEGEQKRPLSGDGLIRQMRTQLRRTLDTAISLTVTDVQRLSDLGITINRTGVYDIDKTKLETAVSADAVSVQNFFATRGVGSTASIEYLLAGDDAVSGIYAIDITQVATQASETGSGGGTYSDDGTPDTLTVTDAGTGSTYDVSLSDGMTMTQIVDALNTEFRTAEQRTIVAATTVYSDAVATPATDSTLLQDLFNSGGANLAVADGDVLTISGTKHDGTSIFRTWTVTDVTTQKLGDLRSEIATAVGAEVDVSFVGGALTVTVLEAGRSTLALTLSSDNAGGGTLSFGSIAATVEGRGKVAITAVDSSGELKLSHADYGASAGFDIAFTAGDADGSASLGLSAGSYRGLDVTGTIGGQAATGSGRILSGDSGTSADGIVLRYSGASTGAVGSLTFSRGISALMEFASKALLDTDAASIKGVLDGIDTQKERIEDRIEQFDLRLERRAESLIKRFTTLEEAMARAQQQANWITSQLAALIG